MLVSSLGTQDKVYRSNKSCYLNLPEELENYKLSGTNIFFRSTSSMGKPKDVAFICKPSQLLRSAILAMLHFCLAKTMILLMLI